MNGNPDSPGTAALDRLERLLLLLPRAQRPGGVTFQELETLLGVDRSTLQSDLDLLTSRAAYLRAGDPADFQLAIEADRIRIFSSGAFERPPRLGAREALALALGLRTRALIRGATDSNELGPKRDATGLLRRLEGVLARSALDQLEPLPVEDASARSADGVFSDRALDAISGRRTLSFSYLKTGDPEPESRRLNPLTMIHAEGRWYLLGQIPEGASDADHGVRAFRLDRILDLRVVEESDPFSYPEGFDPRDFLEASRVFSATETEAVVVDYSPHIARWIAERLDGEPLDDGGLRVTHQVADREWFIRHVLKYGGEAVAHPPGREWVLEALRRNRRGGRGSSGA